MWAAYASDCKGGEGFVVARMERVPEAEAREAYARYLRDGHPMVRLLRGGEVVSKRETPAWAVTEYDFGSVRP